MVNPDSIWWYRSRVARDLIIRFGGHPSDTIHQSQTVALVALYAERSRWSKRGCYAALRWCLKTLHAPVECMALVPSMKSSQARTVTVPDSEFNRTVEAAEPRARFALLLARLCGLRVGTILRLEPRHIGPDRITVPSKGSTWTDIPISPRVRIMLEGLRELCPQSCVPYLLQLGIKHRYQLSRRIHAAQIAAGCGGKWTTHDLRRTFARQIYQNTKDIRSVQKAMAHRNPVHTLWYLDNPEAALTLADLTNAEPKGSIQ